MSGGGLTWTLATRAGQNYGTAEVWQAYATAPFAAKVTASLTSGGFDGSITVAAFSGTKALGARATAFDNSVSPSVKINATAAGSLLWAAGHDWSTAATRNPLTGQRIVHQFVDKPVHDTFWTQSVDTATQSGSQYTVGVTEGKKDRWQMAAVEILPLTP